MHLRSSSRRWLAACLLAPMLAACPGGSDSGTPVSPAPTPAIALSPSVATITVTAGASGTATFTVTRSGGFTGAVNLAATSSTAGVTATFAPSALDASTTSGTLTVTTTAAVPAGSYTIGVRASGTGVTEKTSSVTLTVAAPAATPAYTMTATPSTLSLVAGASGTSAIAFARTGGFSGAVSVAVTGAPAGVTASVAPSPTTLDATTLTVNTTTAAAPGTYTLTLTASATGLTDRTTTVALTVTAPAPTPAYTMTIAPTTLSLAAGASGTSAVTLVRSGGFAGAVSFAVTGAPAGVTATVAPTPTTTNAATITVAVGASVAPGTYTLTLIGTATGMTDRTATLALTVTAPAGDYSISAAPTTVSLAQGATVDVTVTINRTGGFNGAVTVDATGLPTGVTATFTSPGGAAASRARSSSRSVVQSTLQPTRSDDITTTATTVIIKLLAASGAATGPFNFTVLATSTGRPNRTAAVSGTVSAGSNNSGAILWKFCDATNLPVWFAYQNGNGAWTRVTSTNNQYRFDITAATGGVAWVVQQSNGPMTQVYYGTAAELTQVGLSQCQSNSTSTTTITGSVTGAGTSDQVSINYGGVATSVTGNAAYTIANAPDGARDIIAARSAISFSGGGFSSVPSAAIIKRGQTSGGVLDFSTQSFALAQRTLTTNNLNGEQTAVIMQYLTSTSSSANLYVDFNTSASASRPYYGIPSAQQQATDLHSVLVTAIAGGATATSSRTRIVISYFKDLIDRAVTLGSALGTPTLSLAATSPNPRPRAQLGVQAEYDKSLTVTYAQTLSSNQQIALTITQSLGHRAGAGSWDITVPDLTGAQGYDAAGWALRSGIPALVSMSAAGWSINSNAARPILDGSVITVGSFVTQQNM